MLHGLTMPIRPRLWLLFMNFNLFCVLNLWSVILTGTVVMLSSPMGSSAMNTLPVASVPYSHKWTLPVPTMLLLMPAKNFRNKKQTIHQFCSKCKQLYGGMEHFEMYLRKVQPVIYHFFFPTTTTTMTMTTRTTTKPSERNKATSHYRNP